MTKTRKEEGKKQVAFLLPLSLADRIRKEAFKRRTYPARIVIEGMSQFFDPKPPAA